MVPLVRPCSPGFPPSGLGGYGCGRSLSPSLTSRRCGSVAALRQCRGATVRPAMLCGVLCGTVPSNSSRRVGSRERWLLGPAALPPTYSLRAGGGCSGILSPKSPRGSVGVSLELTWP